MDLCINMRTRYIHCLTCRRAFLPDHVRPHIAEKHKATLRTFDWALFEAAIESTDVDVRREWEDPGDDPRLAYDGLEVVHGHQCPHCPNRGFATADSMRRHFRRFHPGIALKSMEKCARVWIQRLSCVPGFACKWFIVHLKTTLAPPSSSAVLGDLKRELDKRMSADAPQDDDFRRFEPWQHRLGLVAHVAGREDIPHLCELVAYPRKGDRLHRIADAILTLNERAMVRMAQTSVLVRRRLATQEPSG